jgi:hypothetical protein
MSSKQLSYLLGVIEVQNNGERCLCDIGSEMCEIGKENLFISKARYLQWVRPDGSLYGNVSQTHHKYIDIGCVQAIVHIPRFSLHQDLDQLDDF